MSIFDFTSLEYLFEGNSGVTPDAVEIIEIGLESIIVIKFIPLF